MRGLSRSSARVDAIGSHPEVARHSAGRVLRGGAFNNDANNLRAAYRNNNDPDNENNNLGFRVVWSSAGVPEIVGRSSFRGQSSGPRASSAGSARFPVQSGIRVAAEAAGKEEGSSLGW